MNPTDSPKKGTLSTSTSSLNFDLKDPHDPNLSNLAKNMFEKTENFIQQELETSLDDYILLENMNRVSNVKYSEMQIIVDSVGDNF
jgi:biogenesis of lysosome-related organelles complex 1 subunit 2